LRPPGLQPWRTPTRLPPRRTRPGWGPGGSNRRTSRRSPRRSTPVPPPVPVPTAQPPKGGPVDQTDAAASHVPVMLEEALELLGPALAPREGVPAVHVDGTLGMAGHAEAVLRADETVRLVGIDRDPHALALAERRLAPFADRVQLVHAVNDEIGEVLDDLGIETVTSAFFD